MSSGDAMTADELKWNEQAVSAASGVLSDQVLAATRCEQVTTDMMAKQAGVGGGTRAMARGGMKLSKGIAKVMPGMGALKGVDSMRDAGLPGTFLLAVTPNQVHAIEVKEKAGADLGAGKILTTWDRPLQAMRGNEIAATAQGVPPDKQMLTLYLPNAKVAQVAGAGMAMPTQFMVGRDQASETVVSTLVG